MLLQERRSQYQEQDELWFGDLSSKGLSAQGRSGYRLERIDTRLPLPRYFIPKQVRGPESFQLISVWAMNDRLDRMFGALCARWTYGRTASRSSRQ